MHPQAAALGTERQLREATEAEAAARLHDLARSSDARLGELRSRIDAQAVQHAADAEAERTRLTIEAEKAVSEARARTGAAERAAEEAAHAVQAVQVALLGAEARAEAGVMAVGVLRERVEAAEAEREAEAGRARLAIQALEGRLREDSQVRHSYAVCLLPMCMFRSKLQEAKPRIFLFTSQKQTAHPFDKSLSFPLLPPLFPILPSQLHEVHVAALHQKTAHLILASMAEPCEAADGTAAPTELQEKVSVSKMSHHSPCPAWPLPVRPCLTYACLPGPVNATALPHPAACPDPLLPQSMHSPPGPAPTESNVH